MQRVLVLQSFNDAAPPDWLLRCVESVRAWSALQGYEYRQQGDSLFALLPHWYRLKVGERTPIAADLARLLWIQQNLESRRYDMVCWIDADVLVLAPQRLQLTAVTSCIFGQEHWLEASTARRVRKNVHNAFCGFRPGCPILPFLIEVTQRLVRRVDARFMAPQFVGPKLLTHLHNTVNFELDARFGALSPQMAAALAEGDELLYRRMLAAMPVPLMAANLCASLHGAGRGLDAQPMHVLIDWLLQEGTAPMAGKGG